MSAPKPPEPGRDRVMPNGDTASLVDREDRAPLFRVVTADGETRIEHWSWSVVCLVCWGWVPRSIGAVAAAKAWHARRFDRRGRVFVVEGLSVRVQSWAVVDGWHVVLFLEDGRRLELGEDDAVITDSNGSAAPPPREFQPPELDEPHEEAAHSRAILSGEAPSTQLGLFGGAA